MIETWQSSKRATTEEKLHQEIASIYRWWAETAPGVWPREEGRLGDLWREVDSLNGEAEV